MPVVISKDKELSVSPFCLPSLRGRGENLLSASTEVPTIANNNIKKSFILNPDNFTSLLIREEWMLLWISTLYIRSSI